MQTTQRISIGRIARAVRPLLAVAVLMGMSACSSIVEGTTQTVTVITDPPGATCNLTRGGAIVAVANPTPASVMVEKSKDNISIACTKAEHLDGAGALASEFEGMTFGNILFGGIIGVAVDSASGAMNKYPASVTIVMPPEKFNDTASRDAFFSRQIARANSEASNALLDIAKNCNPNERDCAALKKAVEESRDRQIEEFERQRDTTVIGG